MAVQLCGEYGKISVFNIYNPCSSNSAEQSLRRYIQANSPNINASASDHMIWAGDFNRHHPLWDRDEDTHLFTREALSAAKPLIDMLGKYGMVMALLKGIPTLQHMVTKRYSRLDNMFCTAHTLEHYINCNINYEEKPTKTDHFPITATLELEHVAADESPCYNFRMADWNDFNENLAI